MVEFRYDDGCFDYGPLDNPNKGFVGRLFIRFTNSAGGTKEIYYFQMEVN